MHEIISLPNGLRIIYERMPAVRSAAIGIFVGVGSRYEQQAENGSAHFIEHMLFKRTINHSAAELAYKMDSIGGQINAYTTRESTCFYAKVLDTHLNTAIDLLTEMFFDCAFDESEAESERGVILEEIGMYEDTPDDVCYERLISGCYKGALGRPVLGKPSTLAPMTGASLKAYKERHYTAGNIVISLCGSFDESHLDRIKEKFSSMEKVKCVKPRKASYSINTTARRKKTEQNQFCIAFPSNSVKSDERFAINLLSTILGGGVSSRLFQNIREKYGLCYSVYTFQATFEDNGLLAVATAVGKETEMRTLSLIGDELRSFAENGASEEELQRAREQAKSSLVMGLESTSSRMVKLGNAMLALNKCLTTDEIIAKYDAVTREDIIRLARDRFDFSKLSLSALGKTEAAEDYLSALNK
ncbi:MAG: pitrilysin family protein [Oscillospiraceae bacterium]